MSFERNGRRNGRRNGWRSGWWAAALLGALLAPGAARGDQVHLGDGRVLEAEALRWIDAGKRLEVTCRLGALRVERGDVVRIVPGPTPAAEVARRRRALGATDTAGAVALARFAIEHGLRSEAGAALVEAWLAAPADDPLREQVAAMLERELDYHRVDGAWVDPDSYYPALGHVKRGGRWVPAGAASAEDERERARAAAAQLRIEGRRLARWLRTARREQEEADHLVRRYERALVNLGAELRVARMELEARERELAVAEAERLHVQATFDRWLASPYRDGSAAAVTQEWRLAGERSRLTQALEDARSAETAARRRVEDLLRLEARGPLELSRAHEGAAAAAAHVADLEGQVEANRAGLAAVEEQLASASRR